MSQETKTWEVAYSHEDGRKGVVNVKTEIRKSGGFQYGNGKSGALTVEGFTQYYDLRYNYGDLHLLMIRDFFGDGLVNAEEL